MPPVLAHLRARGTRASAVSWASENKSGVQNEHGSESWFQSFLNFVLYFWYVINVSLSLSLTYFSIWQVLWGKDSSLLWILSRHWRAEILGLTSEWLAICLFNLLWQLCKGCGEFGWEIAFCCAEKGTTIWAIGIPSADVRFEGTCICFDNVTQYFTAHSESVEDRP